MYPYRPSMNAPPVSNDDPTINPPTTEAPSSNAPPPPFTYRYLHTCMDVHMVLLHVDYMVLLHMVIHMVLLLCSLAHLMLLLHMVLLLHMTLILHFILLQVR
jgi:hypothetical protein